ncbi:MAG TPA: tRNA (adenosine(37)-N6)-dimethylallyltransferase MiaA [Thermoanaerobaculia bacterium]|nr:tRNA (adenosine(37)-N6)-dimethylallyltransferase MiaA [Thermoanaerobaculia bacterium]
MEFPLIILSGPTGIGKSETAVTVALEIGAEIVNCDSVQIYKGFDVGSAKPAGSLRSRIPHHLLDVVDANQDFNAADYARSARSVCEEIRGRGKTPMLVGGTGFYLRALLGGLSDMPPANDALRARLRMIASRAGGAERLHRWLKRIDPATARVVSMNDRYRVERALEVYMQGGRRISEWQRPSITPSPLVAHFALTMPRAELVPLLNARVRRMYESGLIEETAALLERYAPSCRPFQSIGYREAVDVLLERRTIAEAQKETEKRTRAYAKRQMTWLRSEQGVQWIESGPKEMSAASIVTILNRSQRE